MYIYTYMHAHTSARAHTRCAPATHRNAMIVNSKQYPGHARQHIHIYLYVQNIF